MSSTSTTIFYKSENDDEFTLPKIFSDDGDNTDYDVKDRLATLLHELELLGRQINTSSNVKNTKHYDKFHSLRGNISDILKENINKEIFLEDDPEELKYILEKLTSIYEDNSPTNNNVRFTKILPLKYIKKNFDPIDRSGFGSFVKKTYNQLENAKEKINPFYKFSFDNFAKKNFDPMDSSGFSNYLKKIDPIDRAGFSTFNKKSFDPIDRAGFNTFNKKSFNTMDLPGFRFLKKSFDPIDRAGFNTFNKKSFDPIDRSGFNTFNKKSFYPIDISGFDNFNKKRFDPIDRSGFNTFNKKDVDPTDKSGFNKLFGKNFNTQDKLEFKQKSYPSSRFLIYKQTNNLHKNDNIKDQTKENVDFLNKSGLITFAKRNFDPIDRSGFDSFFKKRNILNEKSSIST